MMHVGLGYDIHRFSETPRPLWLGGVKIHESKGLLGHSDADVLCHAIADAILGSIGESDIGTWFPPDDPNCKDIRSVHIVEKAVELLYDKGGSVFNLDCIVIAEAPIIKPYVPQMKETLASILGIETDRVAIKATTNEMLGAIGRGEGIAAFAVASILFAESE